MIDWLRERKRHLYWRWREFWHVFTRTVLLMFSGARLERELADSRSRLPKAQIALDWWLEEHDGGPWRRYHRWKISGVSTKQRECAATFKGLSRALSPEK